MEEVINSRESLSKTSAGCNPALQWQPELPGLLRTISRENEGRRYFSSQMYSRTMERLGRNYCRIGEILTPCGFARKKVATWPGLTRPMTLLPVWSLPVHRLGESFCMRHKKIMTDEQGWRHLPLCRCQPLRVENQQGELTLVSSTHLGPVACFPLWAGEVTASLHCQFLLLAALAVVQDVVVGVHTHGSPPPCAPAAALGALRGTHTQ